MFKTYESDSLAGLYKCLYSDLKSAEVVAPRGFKTKEILCPTLVLTNPQNRIAYHPDRKFSLRYALVESLMIIDKANELKYFSKFNGNIQNFSDDGKTLYGSYGYRIADYVLSMINRLKRDEDSRQAVLPILRVADPYIPNTKDVPCTLSLHFIIRDGRLNLVTTMRSNDVIWGLPYDVFTFTMLQEVVANTLGIPMGWYMHRPTSLHLYEKHFDMFDWIADNFVNVKFKNDYVYTCWEMIKDDYKDFVDGKNGELFESVYQDIKAGYKNV